MCHTHWLQRCHTHVGPHTLAHTLDHTHCFQCCRILNRPGELSCNWRLLPQHSRDKRCLNLLHKQPPTSACSTAGSNTSAHSAAAGSKRMLHDTIAPTCRERCLAAAAAAHACTCCVQYIASARRGSAAKHIASCKLQRPQDQMPEQADGTCHHAYASHIPCHHVDRVRPLTHDICEGTQ